MTKNSTSSTGSTWTGMVPVDDTALAVTDTGGPGIPVLYLNGQFATQGYWRRVIAELGTGWRHITYDERARGKSKRSADYSFEAAVREENADIHYAQSGIFTPCDFAFARDGVAAECTPNIETVIFHDVDIELVKRQRQTGTVLNWGDRRKDLYQIRYKTGDKERIL